VAHVEVARKAQSAKGASEEDRVAFLEELIVRRELAVNFVEFEAQYDSFSCLPDWARRTLLEHAKDTRPIVYSAKELERAETHDQHWNAAMGEMKKTGYMHNYMRMYWGKKILEWSNTPEHAYRTTLDLNNRYFLDGRDPASYANVAWIFGLHDRAWGERAILGKVRYMSAEGLKRKFDVDAYVKWVDELPEG
jgi:deoxyribodipyrimidine photo-lyase